MSYCRFSSDDYKCDVYVYEDVTGGYTTHVAKNKVVFCEELPAPVPFDNDHLQAWIDRNDKVRDIMRRSEKVKIGLPHDGKTFNDSTATDCAARLKSLRAEGYNVPQHAIDALEAEKNENVGGAK